ncbi:hypothetical protein IMZ48_13215 [Candidatus Bathyarchaeota archaeon]|nr:hypothetical protein [Candidatus Bathyarchaeota archaeon]
MERKAQAAAAGFNQTLEALITSDMISVCQGITLVQVLCFTAPLIYEVPYTDTSHLRCIALVPPMQIHLLNLTSGKPLIATLGQHSLEICMLVANELRKTYFGAELLHRLFSQAKTQIANRKTRQDATEDSQPTKAATSLDTPMPHLPHLPHEPTQGDQGFTDTDTIKNLGSAFTGFDYVHGGYEYV